MLGKHRFSIHQQKDLLQALQFRAFHQSDLIYDEHARRLPHHDRLVELIYYYALITSLPKFLLAS